MSTALDQAWGQATANLDQSPASGDRPSPGLYVAQVVTARADTAKSGEFYFSLTFALQDGRRWDEVKMITRNGQLDEGRAKSAAIMLRGLGLVGEPASPTNLPNTIKSIVNKFYAVEITQSNQVNQNTGQFYLNTEVNGPANGWVGSDIPAPAAAQPQAAPAVQMAPTQVQTPQGVASFPPAVQPPAPTQVMPQPQAQQAMPQAHPGPQMQQVPAQAPVPQPTLDQALTGQAPAATMQQQVQQAQAQGFGDDLPWDNPGTGAVAGAPITEVQQQGVQG